MAGLYRVIQRFRNPETLAPLTVPDADRADAFAHNVFPGVALHGDAALNLAVRLAATQGCSIELCRKVAAHERHDVRMPLATIEAGRRMFNCVRSAGTAWI